MSTDDSSSIKFLNEISIPCIGWKAIQGLENEKAEESLDFALEAGFRLIDTSFEENTEVPVGSVLKRWFDEEKLQRDEIFITAKLPSIGNSAEGVEYFLQQSLTNLQLNYVDLYLVQSPVGLTNVDNETCFPFTTDYGGKHQIVDLDRHTDLITVWKAMELAVDCQFAKSIGLVNFNARQVKLVIRNARIPPATVQIELHPYFQQKLLRPLCKKYGIVITSFAPFGYALEDENALIKHHKIPFDPSAKDGKHLRKRPKVPMPLDDETVKLIVARKNKTPRQILLRFLYQTGIVAIVQTHSLDIGRECMDVFEFELTKDEEESLSKLDRGLEGRMFDLATIIKGYASHNEEPFHETF